MKPKITATFSDGYKRTRKTDRTYTHAWRVTGVWAGKARDVGGFSSSYALAAKAVAVYTTPAACWIDPKPEIVTVEKEA